MRSIVATVALLAGCASAAPLQRDIAAHDRRAAALQAQGRYAAACRERAAAAEARTALDERAPLETRRLLPPMLQ